MRVTVEEATVIRGHSVARCPFINQKEQGKQVGPKRYFVATVVGFAPYLNVYRRLPHVLLVEPFPKTCDLHHFWGYNALLP